MKNTTDWPIERKFCRPVDSGHHVRTAERHDGVVSAEERVLFMTTKHVCQLDPALIRPGHVDVKQYFGNCTGPMFEQMFAKFFDGILAQMCAQFRDKVSSLGSDFSPASIQGHLLNYKTDPTLFDRKCVSTGRHTASKIEGKK
uniref:Mitochondrial chaperone BCS1-like ATPase lid domain-containing protein n=1 Tax=Globodera rostochiensis TaxID=31243 RepID=A0A914GR42_GLORO